MKTKSWWWFVLALEIVTAGFVFGQTLRLVPARRVSTIVTSQTTNETESVELPPGIVLPPGVQLPGFPGTNQVAAKTNAPVSPDEKRLQELLKLQFDRRPSAVLQALAKKVENKASTNEVQRFQADVVTGDWKAVKEFLAKLPEKHAPQVYKHLLTALDKGPSQSSAPSPMPEIVVSGDASEIPPEILQQMQMQQSGGNRQQPQPVLLPEDVLALADAAPGELKDENAEQLGKLLSRALGKGNFIDPFLAKLEAGTKNLGGKDQKKRDLAAKLLIAANRLTDAGKFLPPLEPALGTNDIKTIDLHAKYLVAVGKQRDETNAAASLKKAWELTQTILSATNAAAKDREQALTRSIDLMPLLSKEMGTNWLRDAFQKKPEQGMAILAAVGEQVTKSASNRDYESRKKNLDTQKKIVDALLSATGGEIKSWRTALNLLALGWISEAEVSKNRYRPQQNQMYPQYDQFGNQIYMGENYYPGQYNDSNQPQPIPIEDVLLAGPNDAWLDALEKSLLPRVRILLAELHLKNEAEQKALPYLEAVAGENPKAARNLANELLRSWARSHNPNQQNSMMNRSYYSSGGMVYYMGSPYGGMTPQGASLTRAMQVRNLADLSKLLERMRALPIGKLDEKAVVGAFSAAHSQAEVFRVEDIEKVFGPVAEIKSETLTEILQTMRQRLAGQWRAPRIQQEAKTNRKDKEIEAEVTRGYELTMQLIERGLEKLPDEWRMHLVHGAALFDWAEFDYGRKVDLAIYVEKRDRAFKSFEKAAAFYAGKVVSLEEKEQTPLVFQQWFNATLGASDLAYITRQTEPNTNHLDKIRAALFGLPGEVVERHVTAFGKGLSESINTLRPELKPRYLRSGIRVVGEHPSAVDARKLATYYDDLLQEITFDVHVDGDTTVGHGKPFGVFVAFRHSEALGREIGGFGKYLQNQQNQGYYYNPYGRQPVNYREDFEKQVREKLSESFEVVSVTFNDDKVQPRGYGRPGWRETPYAYLQLKAKDGAVDRIPPLQMDLDFFDRRGQVVLPVFSLVQLIDARPESVAARPVKKIELTQILDDRDLKTKGTLALEIKAEARGILPELKELMDAGFAGFKVDKIDDKGMAITKIDNEGDDVAPVSERNWLISLSADTGGAAKFNFPKSKLDDVKQTYKRYADADIVEVKPELALAGVVLRPVNLWKWITVSGVLIIAAVAGFFVWRKQKPARSEEFVATYRVPQHITPFTVLTLLQRMQADEKLALNAEQRRELGETIATVQRSFFDRRAKSANGEPDLTQLAQRWISHVR